MDIKKEIEKIVDESIKPAIRSHGGDVEVIDYYDHVLQIRLTGACENCPMANLSTKKEIEETLKTIFPELQAVELVDTIDPELLRFVRSILSDDKKSKKAVKYCGGCNPTYDRSSVVQRLEKKLGAKFEIAEANHHYDEVYVICGCSARCADISEIQADRVIMVDSPEFPEQSGNEGKQIDNQGEQL